MAEKIKLEVEVGGEKKITKVKDSLQILKAELKAANALALNGDGKAAKRVAELTDKIDDLKDSTKALTGSTIEKGNKAIANLGEGFMNLDFDKVKLGFKGLGSAIAATGIGLLIPLIAYLVENFDDLKKSTGILGTIFRGIGDVIDWVGKKITWLTDKIGLSNSVLEKQGEQIEKTAEKTKEAMDAQSAAYDRQISQAKAAGKNTLKIEVEKQNEIIKTNNLVLAQALAFIKAGGELSESQKKIVTATIESNAAARSAIKVAELADDKEKADKLKEKIKKLKEDRAKQAKEDIENHLKEVGYKLNAEIKAFEDAEKEKTRIAKEAQDAKNEEQKLNDAEFIASLKRGEDEFKKSEDAKKQFAKETVERKTQIESNYFNAAKGLSDLFFQFQLNSAKGNAAKELELKKKQFQVEKAFNVARSIMDTVKGVQATIATGGALAIPLAVSVGILGAVNTAKIAAAKFDAGGGSASVDVSAGGATNVPQINTPQNTPSSIQPSTQLNSNGQAVGGPTRVYVLQSDIADANRVATRLQDQSSF